MYCQNCGQTNTQTSNFCRFCGTKMTAAAHYSNGNGKNYAADFSAENYEYAPPRPYSWKTDEFQIQNDRIAKTKSIDRVQPLPPFQNPVNAPLQPSFQPSPALSHDFHCPRCSSHLFPRVTRQISTAGWIVFAVLLVFFFPLFWIGFLIKDEVRLCPVCNFQYQ